MISLRVALSRRSQLADLVGASRAKVGQVLRDLERKKIVIRDGHHLAVVTRGSRRWLDPAVE